MTAVLRITLVLSFLVSWMTFWYSSVSAQEYLPPKNGKKPVAEAMPPANYNYSYVVQDTAQSLDFGHNEKRKDDRASGSYHVLLPDGRMMLVEYEAGPDGYKPVVMFMGTATYPTQASDKFDGYHYNAASNRQTVRQPAPRTRQTPSTAAPPAPHAPVAHAPPATVTHSTTNTTQIK